MFPLVNPLGSNVYSVVKTAEIKLHSGFVMVVEPLNCIFTKSLKPSFKKSNNPKLFKGCNENVCESTTYILYDVFTLKQFMDASLVNEQLFASCIVKL